MILVGVWQFPHFWMTLLIHRREYAGSNMPTMLTLFSEGQMARLVFAWLAGFAFLSLLPPLYNLVHAPWAIGLLVINAGSLVLFSGVRLASRGKTACFPILSRHVNGSIGVVMAVIVIDPLVALF